MSNSKSVSDAIAKWAVKNTQEMQQKLHDDIKADTPVRTGRAQAGWENTVVVAELGDVGVIENMVPYIGWLEFGSDTVEAAAMVRTNLNSVGK